MYYLIAEKKNARRRLRRIRSRIFDPFSSERCGRRAKSILPLDTNAYDLTGADLQALKKIILNPASAKKVRCGSLFLFHKKKLWFSENK
jgi:hypothetical protein